MNLESLKEPLGERFGELEQYINDLIGQRDAARKESQTGRQTLKAKAEEATATVAQLMEKLGIETLDELETMPPAKGQAEALKQLETRLKALDATAKAKEAALTELTAKHRAVRLDAELSKALGGHEFIDREVVEDYLRRRVDWNEDQAMYRTEKGDLIPLTEGVANLTATRPHLLKTPGARGSGYNPNSQQGQGRSALKRTAFDALPPAAKVEHVKAGGAVID